MIERKKEKKEKNKDLVLLELAGLGDIVVIDLSTTCGDVLGLDEAEEFAHFEGQDVSWTSFAFPLKLCIQHVLPLILLRSPSCQ